MWSGPARVHTRRCRHGRAFAAMGEGEEDGRVRRRAGRPSTP